MRALLHVLRTSGPLRLLVPALLLAGAADLGAVALMTTAAWLIARAAEQPDMAALSLAIVTVRALAVSRGLFRYGERLFGHDAALTAVATLRRRVFGALVRRPARQGVAAPRGADTVTRLVADVDLVQDALLRVAVPTASAVLTSAATLCCAALLAPPAALVLAAGLVVGGLLVPAVTALLSRRAARRSAALRSELAVLGTDLLDGAADLQAFGAVGPAVADAAGTARRLRRRDRGAARLSAVAAAVLTVVQGATTLGVAVVCAGLTSAGGLHRVWAVALPLLVLASFEVLAPLPAAAQLWGSLTASARRVRALLAADGGPPPGVREDTSSPGECDERVSVAANGSGATTAAPGSVPRPGAAHLTVRALHVRYRAAGPAALRGVDLDLPPGRRVGVVGASGSGKSTLLAAVARFVEPEAGDIVLGGRPLATVPDAELRRTVSGALQDAHVFDTTLRNNLLPARPGAHEEELSEALRAAGLLPWVRSLPRGLDTPAGPDGGWLSGGQRQRLVLARALLASPPLMLLDEPTESLDPATADAVLADVLRATEGRSLLLVTHRWAGLEALDEVVVMDEGRIVRRGTARAVLESSPTRSGEAAPVGG